MKNAYTHARLHFLIVLSGFIILISAVKVLAETPAFELQCRQKAKEVAAETYRGCVTENRKVQIEQLKSDYQQKLKSLKDEYEAEIKKMSGKRQASEANNTSASPITTTLTKKAGRSGARSSSALRSLPSKETERETYSSSEMNVRLRTQPHDDSAMDIPEPIPVESVPTDSDSGV